MMRGDQRRGAGDAGRVEEDAGIERVEHQPEILQVKVYSMPP